MSKAKTSATTSPNASTKVADPAPSKTKAGAKPSASKPAPSKASASKAAATKPARSKAAPTRAPAAKAATTKAATTKAATTKAATTRKAAPRAAARRKPAAAATPSARAPRARRRAQATTSATATAPPAAKAPAEVGADSFQVSDGTRLHYQVSRPEGKAKRLVMLVHGFADHSDRYSFLVPHLVARGAVVYAYDQRGNGRSEGKRGHVMQYQRLVDDLDAFIKLATGTETGLRRVLYAHSTGAIAALTYLYDNATAVDAVVLSAPCLILTFDAPGWKTTVGKALSSVVPGFTMQAGFDPGAVSRDEQVVAANKSDRLVTQKMTARFYTETYLKAMPAALARIEQLTTPYLVLQGTDDKLVSPRVADEFESRAAAHGVVKRYQGGYHESHNDVHREEVFADVDAWLEGR